MAAIETAGKKPGLSLEPGDRAPVFVLPDQTGAKTAPLEDRYSGKPAVLVFRADPADAQSLEELAAFQARQADFAARETSLFAITGNSVSGNARVAAEKGIGFKLLSDQNNEVTGSFGLRPGAPITVVLDPNYRIAAWLGPDERADHLEAALSTVTALQRGRTSDILVQHPPLLVIPRALSPDDCRMLMRVFEREARVYQSDGFTAEGHDTETEDFKVRVESYGRVTAHIIKDRELAGYLDAKLGRRINPEIQKSYQTRVTKREDLRIACYDAEDRGHLGAHRDNPTPQTRHRRFTFSITLNAGEFKGGALRFPEYGAQRYLVETGSAIIWSAALLHEVEQIAEGRRFILGAHLYGG